MKTLLKNGLFVCSMICCVTAWSFGTGVDLGNFQLPPGLSKLTLSETHLHYDVGYTIQCTMEPLQENSAIAISKYNMSAIKIKVKDKYYYPNETILLPDSEAIHLQLENVIRHSNNEIIYFKNFDQTQTFAMHCTADIDK